MCTLAVAFACSLFAASAYAALAASSRSSCASCVFLSRASWRVATGSGCQAAVEPFTGSITEAYEAREVAQAALFNRKEKIKKHPKKEEKRKVKKAGMLTRM